VDSVISAVSVDATATLEALFGPLKCDALTAYSFWDVSKLWQPAPLAQQQFWHQRFVGSDLTALLMQLAERLLSAKEVHSVICNIGHPKLSVSLVQFQQAIAIVDAHFNVPAYGTIWTWPGQGYVIDVLVSGFRGCEA
jgi:hypothetical protein